MPAASTWPANLVQRRQLENVVQHAHQADHDRCDQHCPGVLLHRHLTAQEWELPGDQDCRRNAGQHGNATEVGHLDGVHIAISDSGQRARPQRQATAYATQ